MFKSISALAIAAAALSTSAIMFSPAAYAADAVQARVSWHDLDLGTAAGQHTLARRIDTAARKVCPDEQLTGTHLSSASVLACRASVRAQVAQRAGAGDRMALSN